MGSAQFLQLLSTEELSPAMRQVYEEQNKDWKWTGHWAWVSSASSRPNDPSRKGEIIVEMLLLPHQECQVHEMMFAHSWSTGGLVHLSLGKSRCCGP